MKLTPDVGIFSALIKDIHTDKIVRYSFLRSSIHCTSFCISTLGCSAFQFNKQTGSCRLGIKTGLILAQPSDNESQLTKLSVNTEGKHTYILYNYNFLNLYCFESRHLFFPLLL